MEQAKEIDSDTASLGCPPLPDRPSLISVYQEICKSHQAIDEFRMKLLGLLPLASLTGIFVLSKSDSMFSAQFSSSDQANHLVAFIGIFAALFTVALFIYEIRGILRCDQLIQRGIKIEEDLEVYGQFRVCRFEYEASKNNIRNRVFNAKVAACFVYSLVFAAWLFLSFRHGFGIQTRYCAVIAPASGIVLFFVVYKLIYERIAA